MQILPQSVTTGESKGNSPIVAKTYGINFENKKMAGLAAGKAALEIAIYKYLQTERFENEIYDGDYGFESMGLIGADKRYVKAELKRRITDALKNDDRILSIDNFKMTEQGDKISMDFTVNSIYGSIDAQYRG